MGRGRKTGRPDDCTQTFYQKVGVDAEVTITPTVQCGPITVTCLEGHVTPCGEQAGGGQHQPGPCRVRIFQTLCVAVPIEFGADVNVEVDRIVCGPPSRDPRDCMDSWDGSDCTGDGSHSESDCGSGSSTTGETDCGRSDCCEETCCSDTTCCCDDCSSGTDSCECCDG